MNSYDLSGATWRKSSYSNAKGECVEVAFLDGGVVALRDSKDNGDGPALIFTDAEWAAFVRGVTNGEFTV
ncbi:DUF397 domain-containing protein [Protofrankia symbiont of Coriaria ruscifolia]|uniref:DUF397 domain-containing protein n=1 Tax=Protofrankia symbiont of Coriaria ruscifolia TaxID=1306542 RepID=UPI001041AAB7|nr:DUF397 domain-containing protein [Protofrankia symbiont of Coriaria ruscifolia]